MTVTQCLPRPRSALFGLVLLAGLCAVGCSVNDTAQGYVYLNGQPVTAGTVVFTDQNSLATYSVNINSDGSYGVTNLLSSNFLVSVLNPQAPLSGVIPDRYADPNTSGLSLDLSGISSTTVTYNINLSN